MDRRFWTCFALTRLALAACGCGAAAPSEHGFADARSHEPVATSTVPAQPTAKAEADEDAPACSGEGHFDLTAMLTSPRCAIPFGDPRIAQTSLVASTAGPLAVRVLDAETPIRASVGGSFAVRLEIENLGPDFDLVTPTSELALRPTVRAAKAGGDAPGHLEQRATSWSSAVALRFQSHAVGELVVPYATVAYRGTRCSPRVNGMHVIELVRGPVAAGTWTLEFPAWVWSTPTMREPPSTATLILTPS